MTLCHGELATEYVLGLRHVPDFLFWCLLGNGQILQRHFRAFLDETKYCISQALASASSVMSLSSFMFRGEPGKHYISKNIS